MRDAIGRRHGMRRRHLQPLGVLVEHRIDDVDEGLVAVEEPVTARQQIALQPALAQVLGQDLHHATVRAQVLVGRARVSASQARLGDLEHVVEPVRRGLVGAEEAEVRRVLRHDVAEETPRATRVASRGRRCRLRHLDRVLADSRAARDRGGGRRRSRAGWRSSAGRLRCQRDATRGTSPPCSSNSSSGR